MNDYIEDMLDLSRCNNDQDPELPATEYELADEAHYFEESAIF